MHAHLYKKNCVCGYFSFSVIVKTNSPQKWGGGGGGEGGGVGR